MKAHKVKGLDAKASVERNAARIVRVRIDELYGFDPAILDPTRIEELHDMRIAAKRLRYVLEITGHCFGEIGDEAEEFAKDMQGAIGEIHDCDVLIPRIEKEISALREQDAVMLTRHGLDALPVEVRRAPGRTRYRGLETLAAALTARRGLLYDDFLVRWRQGQDDRLRHRLEDVLDGIDRRRKR
jgi:hypothetical protein